MEKKAKKKRPKHYEPPLKLKEGTKFIDVIRAAVKDKPTKKEDKK